MMAFSTRPAHAVHAEINMIPLIDVMLVLLIVFMVAAPLMTRSVGIQLPQTAAVPRPAPPEVIRLSIDRAGRLHWNDTEIAEALLPAQFARAARQSPQPELRLLADQQTPYAPIARVMALAAREGLTKLGFESLPDGH